jgi:hemoglobin-like flavoprotein
MNEQQRLLVIHLLDRALAAPPLGEPDLVTLFYNRLFEVAPSVRELFHNRMTAQHEKFREMLLVIRASLLRLDQLVPALWQAGKNHRLYGAEPAHYAVVGEALLWAIEQRLGPETITEEDRISWRNFYDLLALIMLQAANE